MAVDKLVDSTALDTSLTAIADAIRAKTGGSSQLVFPMQFVSEIGNIPSGGGGSVDSGTVVFSENTTTFSVDLDFEPTVFVFGCPVADVGTANSWKSFFGAYYDDPGIVTAGIKYGANAASGQFYAKSKFSYANGKASITLNYPCLAGITFYWMACA